MQKRELEDEIAYVSGQPDTYQVIVNSPDGEIRIPKAEWLASAQQALADMDAHIAELEALQ